MNTTTYKLVINSLKQSLKAYCLTVRNINIYHSDLASVNEGYSDACFETIVHLQSFFELAIKEILIERINYNEADIEKKIGEIYTAKITDLISNKFSKLDNITEGDTKLIKKLNRLRNRLWHQGTELIDISELDNFIPKVLGTVNKVWKMLPHNNYAYGDEQRLIRELRNIYFSKADPLVKKKKIFLVKELTLAKINSPIAERLELPKSVGTICGAEQLLSEQKREYLELIKEYYENMAISLARNYDSFTGNEYTVSTRKCPVCDSKTLVEFWEEDSYYENETTKNFAYIDKVECNCCKLCIPKEIGNPKEVGIKNLDLEFSILQMS